MLLICSLNAVCAKESLVGVAHAGVHSGFHVNLQPHRQLKKQSLY